MERTSAPLRHVFTGPQALPPLCFPLHLLRNGKDWKRQPGLHLPSARDCEFYKNVEKNQFSLPSGASYPEPNSDKQRWWFESSVGLESEGLSVVLLCGWQVLGIHKAYSYLET